MLKVLLKVKVVQGDKSIMEGKRKLISLTVNSACIVWFLWSNLITITNAEKEPVDDSIVTLPPVSLLFKKKYKCSFRLFTENRGGQWNCWNG